MEKTLLSPKDLEMVLESLKYTKIKFEEYQEYPSYEYKQGRIREVEKVNVKIWALKNKLKNT